MKDIEKITLSIFYRLTLFSLGEKSITIKRDKLFLV